MFDPNKHASKPGSWKGGNKPLFPVGPHLVTVQWAEKTISAKGSERITFKLACEVGSAAGMSISDDCYLSEAAAWKLASFALSAGVSEAFSTDDPQALLETFVGKKMKIVVREDEYTNKDGHLVQGRKIVAYESIDPKVKAQQRAATQARFNASRANGMSALPEQQDENIPF